MTEKTETALTQAPPAALVRPDYGFDVARVVSMRAAVEEVIDKVLHEGEHFGALKDMKVKEGEKPKKMLFQAGAEVLCQVFRLRPEFHEITVIERDDFIYYKIKCKLFNSVTGELMGEALGSANTREAKYANQTTAKLCPQCGKPAIIKGDPQYGGGWVCWKKKDGCGAKFDDEDKKLIDQSGVINSNKVWDLHHTILSQAQKRPYVRAVRNATGTSNIFTDEDVPPDDEEHGQPGANAHGQRTQTKPATGPKILATDVLKLTETLRAAELLPADLEKMAPAERDPATRKLWLDWVNGMLEDVSRPKVGSMMEIPQDMVEALLKAAKEKKLPKGW